MTDEDMGSGHVPDRLDTAMQMILQSIPSVGGAMGVFADHERQRYVARLNTMSQELVQEVGLEALAGALRDERRARLLATALNAYGRSDWESKRQALRSVAAGTIAGDDANLDDSDLLIDALADLDRPHVSLLTRFVVRIGDEGQGVLANQLEPRPHPSALSGLVRHGMLSDEGLDGGGATYDGGTIYGVTPFGRDFLALINAEDLNP